MTFSTLGLSQPILRAVEEQGYNTPTPIQIQAIPVILKGQDLLASAQTGTGKTAGFTLPLLHRLSDQPPAKSNHIKILILAPTRELASQIQGEFNIFKQRTILNSILCIGGSSINFQIRQLARNPAFVIGTPGRLIDLEGSNIIDFGSFDAIVLDEVDTMFDMGFISDIKYVISKLPKKRQSLFFSATIPLKVKDD